MGRAIFRVHKWGGANKQTNNIYQKSKTSQEGGSAVVFVFVCCLKRPTFGKQKNWTFRFLMKQCQIELVLLIMMEPAKKKFAETSSSKVNFTEKNYDLLAGLASTI